MYRSVPVTEKAFLSFWWWSTSNNYAQLMNWRNTMPGQVSFVSVKCTCFPDVYKRIIDEGHAVGNHSFNHLNGWKTNDAIYLDDIAEAKKYIDSNLFRPPYGRITRFQLDQLNKPRFKLKTVMWSVWAVILTRNFLRKKCLKNVLNNSKPGYQSLYFHDSEKAMERWMQLCACRNFGTIK